MGWQLPRGMLGGHCLHCHILWPLLRLHLLTAAYFYREEAMALNGMTVCSGEEPATPAVCSAVGLRHLTSSTLNGTCPTDSTMHMVHHVAGAAK